MKFNELAKWEQDVQTMRNNGCKFAVIAQDLHIPLSTVYHSFKRNAELYAEHCIKMDELLKSKESQGYATIFVIGDTQVKAGTDLEYMHWIGNYIAEKRPDIIVHIGDHYDMASLSSYDKGKLKAEGKRFHEDIQAGDAALAILDSYIKAVPNYNPRKVVTIGNHEERIMRWVEENPEFAGCIGYELLGFKEYGWEVYDYLKPVDIHGIKFVHYLANPNTGKPLGGTARSRLSKVRSSFVMGHQQALDWCLEPMPLDPSRMQIGIIVGACYPHDEDYKGYQGNNHFRGAAMLYEVKDGSALPMPVSLGHMQRKYQGAKA